MTVDVSNDNKLRSQSVYKNCVTSANFWIYFAFQDFVLQKGFFTILEYGIDDRESFTPIALFLDSMRQVSTFASFKGGPNQGYK